jgi:hypothetical protein
MLFDLDDPLVTQQAQYSIDVHHSQTHVASDLALRERKVVRRRCDQSSAP